MTDEERQKAMTVSQIQIMLIVLTLLLITERHGSRSILARASVSKKLKSTLERVRVLLMTF